MSATFLGELRIPGGPVVALLLRAQPVVPPRFRHVMMRHVHPLGAFDERDHLPARPVRQTGFHRRAGQRCGQVPRPNGLATPAPDRTPPPIQQPAETLVTEVSMVAICPIWVFIPVPVTSIEAVPLV